MADITTRETSGGGATVKGSPLTNAEVDTNFINLNTDKVEVSGAIIFEAKAGEALSKGDVVYVSGVSGNQPVVSKADANDASKMPAYGLAEADANLNAAVNVVTFGTLYDLDTSSFAAGDTVYVSTTAGAITTTAPTGESSLLQNIGTVIRSHASAGSIKVGGAGRTNATPNLNDGNVFIGNASNQAEARALTGDDISGGTITNFASTGIDDNATETAIDITSNEVVGIGPAVSRIKMAPLAAGGPLIWSSNGSTGTLDMELRANNFEFTNASFTSLLSILGGVPRVGINKSIPTKTLDVNGDANVSGDLTVDTNTLYVDSTNNRVGIGNAGSTLTARLSVDAATNASEAVRIGSPTGGGGAVTGEAYLGLTAFSAGTAQTYPHAWIGVKEFDASDSRGSLIFGTRQSSADVAPTTAMTIDSSGNVGIGDSAPIDRLVVSRLGTNWVGVAPQAITTALFHSGTTNDSSGSAITIAGGDTATNAVYFSNESDNDVGAVIYSNSDDSMRFRVNNSERMYISSSGNVAIGVTSPTYPLHVASNSSGGTVMLNANTAAGNFGTLAFRQENGTTENGKIVWNNTALNLRTNNSTVMTFSTGGNNERMRIDSSGRVGLGVSSALTAKLCLENNDSIAFQDTVGNNRAILSYDTSNDIIYGPAGAGINNHIWKKNGSELMRINTAGNVGIGVTNPTNGKLCVDGTINITDAAGTYAAGALGYTDSNWGFLHRPPRAGAIAAHGFQSFAGGTLMSVAENGNVDIGTATGTGGHLQVYQNSSTGSDYGLSVRQDGTDPIARFSGNGDVERVRITNTGNLLVGIQSTGVNARFRGKTAVADATANAIYLTNSSGTTLQYVRADGLFSTGTATNSPYNFSTTGRDAYINNAGQLGYLSSVRDSKLNIQGLDDISWLYQLNAVSFNYKVKDDNGEYTDEAEQEVEYGLVAEEVEQVNANLCFYDEDEEGNKTLAGVTYRKLIPVLTKAIQEQQAMIEELKAEVAALKGA